MRVEIIAEIGSNHDGSLGQAMSLAQAAVASGADTVKFQDHRWQDIPAVAQHPPWMRSPELESRGEYIRRTCFHASAWELLSRRIRAGARFMVSPFSVRALQWHLEAGTLDAVKIASGQVTNRPLLELARDSGLPVYLSSGMSTDIECMKASSALGPPILGACMVHGMRVILGCTSEYPCLPEHVPEHVRFGPLAASLSLLKSQGWSWGYSDHTLGMAASLAAITLGAAVIERHVGWSRQAYGSDAGHSLTMEEFAAFVREVRDLEKMLSSTVTKDEMAKRLEKTREQFLYREGSTNEA